MFVLAEIKELCFRYFNVEKHSYLQESPLTAVTTFDSELLSDGYDLQGEEDHFTIAVGMKPKVQNSEASSAASSLAVVDPRLGWFVAELVEYKTDSYHGTLTRNTRELVFKECTTETPEHLISQTCIDFKTKKSDGSIDSDIELKLFGSYDGYGKDFSYLKLYFERCSNSRLR